jgi:hypothetical protein
MRKNLLDLINRTIVYKYDLPHAKLSIEKTILSTCNDKCYEAVDQNNLSEIIYNSIIEYSFNEFEINDSDYNDLLETALQERIRFNDDDSDEVQLKYGFFGEVVLYAILKVIYGVDSLISKGYFYSPIENSEAKGYDSYHLIESNSKIQLWFGESKFHKSYSTAIDDVLKKISNSLSDKYLKNNLLAIRKNKENLNIAGSKMEKILTEWSKNPRIIIIDELKKYDIELVHPILILFQENKKGYDDSIRAVPRYIEKKYTVPPFQISIPYTLYFILMPISNVRTLKTEVLSWIKSRKQLIS